MGFFSVTPRSREYIGYNVEGIPLNVVQSNKGVDFKPNIKFNEATLDNGNSYFHNNTGKADSFTVSVIISEDEEVQGKLETDNPMEWVRHGNIMAHQGGGKTISFKRFSIIEMLDYFIRKGEPFYVTTNAVEINNQALWLITDNKNRTQSYDDGLTVWSLTFTKYTDVTLTVFKNNNKVVTNAIKKYNKSKETKKKQTTAKTKTTSKYKLQHNCKASQLKYSKTKKTVKCVEYMQRILNSKVGSNLTIDGWYGNETRKAVKKFQTKYKTKYKLSETGNVDSATYKALYTA